MRVIEPGNPEPGPWKTSRAEYLREFMDVFSDPDIEDVVGVFCSQAGKTEALLNVLGYFADADPSEILFVAATLPMARSASKKRIGPMLERILGAKLEGFLPGAKKSGQEILDKDFPGGGLAIAGANSPAGLASRPLRVVLGDEVDRWPESAGSEGDPVEIVTARTSNYEGSSKRGWISSPGTKGRSRIWPAWEESDQRHYFIVCPACGKEQRLVWEQVKFDGEEPDEAAKTARYECAGCAAVWHEAERDELVAAGRWIKTHPARSIAGFHLNALYSPWQTFGALVKQFLRTRGQPERLKAFVNTRLAELWDPLDGGDVPEADELVARREPYGGRVPAGVLLLTAGVDVQDDRIEAEILGTGRNGETWSIDYAVLHGEPAELLDGDDDRLDEFLARRFVRDDGAPMKIESAAVDSGGHFTEEVYRFCRARTRRKVYAIRGLGGEGAPLWPLRSSRSGKKGTARAKFFRVGVDTGKLSLLRKLKTATPGPGYAHFPELDQYDAEYFQQLTGEAWVIEYRAGRKRAGFKQIYPRVEALDCRVYASAAVAALRPNWPKVETKLRALAEEAREAASAAGVDIASGEVLEELAEQIEELLEEPEQKREKTTESAAARELERQRRKRRRRPTGRGGYLRRYQ